MIPARYKKPADFNFSANSLQEFRACVSTEQLASVLGVPLKDLTYWVYRMDEDARYRIFSIPKKAGGLRTISAPCSALKIVQTRLAALLLGLYRLKPCVHGFAVQRNIVTNAQEHRGKKFVLNFDLQDFFPSINFGRVFGMFKAPPYGFPPKVAALLAGIATHKNALPQGSPTSPVISNMVCARMDGELMGLAQRFGCFYTRYADDITISCAAPRFPQQLAVRDSDGITTIIELALSDAIARNGFKINDKKSRLLTRQHRQEVTGLTVNLRINCERSFANNLRAVLHDWSKNGKAAAEEKYQKLNHEHKKPGSPPTKLEHVVNGKIAFLQLVRGGENALCQKYRNQLSSLLGINVPKKRAPIVEAAHSATWIVQSSDENDDSQGCAIAIDGIGLVTCYHVVQDHIEKGRPFVAFHPDRIAQKLPVVVTKHHRAVDLAVVQITLPHGEQMRSLPVSPADAVQGNEIFLTGYPSFYQSDSIRVTRSEITGTRIVSSIARQLPSAIIYKGGSGGGVLDSQLRVVGIAACGAQIGKEHASDFNMIIPISALAHLP